MFDTCDQCGVKVRATVRAIKDGSDLELTFCDHHARRNSTALTGWRYVPAEATRVPHSRYQPVPVFWY